MLDSPWGLENTEGRAVMYNPNLDWVWEGEHMENLHSAPHHQLLDISQDFLEPEIYHTCTLRWHGVIEMITEAQNWHPRSGVARFIPGPLLAE